jgi:hypothetical protein
MAWPVKLIAGVLVLLVVVAGGLAIYGSQVTPKRHTVEQTLPDARFPH